MDKKPYEYDFNVIYNRTHGKTDTVSAFVDYIAEDFLEGDHMLKGYFADRDMLPGRNLFDENIRVIEQSKFTIIVLDIGFINNSWSMYLNQLSSKTLIDKGPVKKGSQRIIPISLNLEPETVTECCKHLSINEAIYFKNDYRYDKRNKNRLVRVIRDGLPLDDPEIQHSQRQNRGPFQDEENRVKKGDIAVGDTSVPMPWELNREEYNSLPPAFKPPPAVGNDLNNHMHTAVTKSLDNDPILGGHDLDLIQGPPRPLDGDDPVLAGHNLDLLGPLESGARDSTGSDGNGGKFELEPDTVVVQGDVADDMSHVQRHGSEAEFDKYRSAAPNAQVSTFGLPEQPILSMFGKQRSDQEGTVGASGGAVKSPDEPDTEIGSLHTVYSAGLGAASAALNNTSRVKRGAKVTSDLKETRQARQETHLISNAPDVVSAGVIHRKNTTNAEPNDPIQRCQTTTQGLPPEEAVIYDDIKFEGKQADDFLDDMADGSQIVPLMVEQQLVSDPSQVLVRGQSSDFLREGHISQRPSFATRTFEMHVSGRPEALLMSAPPQDASQSILPQATMPQAPPSAQVKTDSAPSSSPQVRNEVAPISAQIGNEAAPASAQTGNDAAPVSSKAGNEAAATSAQTENEAAPISAQASNNAVQLRGQIEMTTSPILKRDMSDDALREHSWVEWRDPLPSDSNQETEVKQMVTPDDGYNSLPQSPDRTRTLEQTIHGASSQTESKTTSEQSDTDSASHSATHDSLAQHRWSDHEKKQEDTSAAANELASRLSQHRISNEQIDKAGCEPAAGACGGQGEVNSEVATRSEADGCSEVNEKLEPDGFSNVDEIADNKTDETYNSQNIPSEPVGTEIHISENSTTSARRAWVSDMMTSMTETFTSILDLMTG